MSAAPKRSRFSDKPEPSADVSAPKLPKTDVTPAWKLPESALVPLGGQTKPKLSREERRRLRKNKWSSEKVEIPGISTNMPTGKLTKFYFHCIGYGFEKLILGLTPEQQMIYMKQLEIEEISRRLRSNDLGIPGTVCYAFFHPTAKIMVHFYKGVAQTFESKSRRSKSFTGTSLFFGWEAIEYS